MTAKIRPAFTIILTIFVIFVKISPLSAQDPVQLRTEIAVGDESEVIIQMQVSGKLQLAEQAQSDGIPLTVAADIRYREMRQSPDKNALAAIREYQKTNVLINVGNSPVTPRLRESRRQVRVTGGAEVEMYSIDGPLTREELDLLQIQGNTLLLDSLLPESQVSIGDSWQHPDPLVVSLLSIDALSVNEVQSTLTEANEAAAIIELSGHVAGAVFGVATEIEVGGKYLYDREAGRITKCQLILKENRAIGHVGPGIQAESTINILVSPQTESTMSNLASAGRLPHEQHLDLECLSEDDFQFGYDRRWHVVEESQGQISLRLVDRGDLIAQARVSPVRRADGGVNPNEFRRQIIEALGERAKHVGAVRSIKTKSGIPVGAFTASGIVSGLPIEWRYYLIGGANGRQAAIVITLEPELASKLGDADKAMVETFQWSGSGVASAAASDSIR